VKIFLNIFSYTFKNSKSGFILNIFKNVKNVNVKINTKIFLQNLIQNMIQILTLFLNLSHIFHVQLKSRGTHVT